MTNEHSRSSFDNIADAVNFAHAIEREVLLEIALNIDERLPAEVTRMLDEEGWTGEELTAILEQMEQGSTEHVDEMMNEKLNEFWRSPDQKKIRRRENWQAFVRGLGGVGAGLYAIAEGMSKIGIGPRPRK